MKLDLEMISKLAEQLATQVKALAAALEKRVNEKLVALEQRIAALPAPKDGKDGKDAAPVDPAVVAELVRQAVDVAAAALPVPKDGKDGKDAAPVDPVTLAELVKQAVATTVAALPAPKDGKDGKDAAPVDPAAVAALVKQAVDAAVAAMPVPKDGKDGKDAAPVDPAAVAALVKHAVDTAVFVVPTPKDGAAGEKGLSAYELAVADGFVGTQKEWLDSLRGERGEPGRGLNGKDGRDAREPVDGKEGQSAYDIAVACGFTGTPTEWVASLRGKDAPPVDPTALDALVKRAVATLPRPRDGKDGKDAAPVDPVAVAELVRQTVAAAMAALPAPKAGDPGKDGEHGRDAADLQILDGVRPGRSYRRGTCVADCGGVLQAVRDTDPLDDGEAPTREKGWGTLMNGLAEEAFSVSEDGRTFTRTARYTDGKVKTFTAEVPVVKYHGVYREGDAYRAGDFVTLSGSVWHCNEHTAVRPGAGAKEWTLAVKCGRDGKDGKQASPSKGNPPVSLR